MSARAPRVVIYDPDGRNPYGREVANLLTEFNPLHVTAADAECASRPLVSQARILPSNNPDTPLKQLGRLANALLVIMRLWVARDVLVVVWTRNVVDALCVRIFQALGLKSLMIVHNPVGRGRQNLIEQLIQRSIARRASSTVVHDELLNEALRVEYATTAAVLPHPMYESYAASAGRQVHCGPNVFRLAFLGSPREDKGLADLYEALGKLPEETANSVVVVLVGKGHTVPAWPRAEVVGGDAFANEAVLLRGLESSCALVAPYRGATASGSVVAAISAGLPVLAYDVGHLATLPGDITLVPVGDSRALSNAIQAFATTHLHGPRGKPVADVSAWNAGAKRAWTSAVGQVLRKV